MNMYEGNHVPRFKILMLITVTASLFAVFVSLYRFHQKLTEFVITTTNETDYIDITVPTALLQEQHKDQFNIKSNFSSEILIPSISSPKSTGTDMATMKTKLFPESGILIPTSKPEFETQMANMPIKILQLESESETGIVARQFPKSKPEHQKVTLQVSETKFEPEAVIRKIQIQNYKPEVVIVQEQNSSKYKPQVTVSQTPTSNSEQETATIQSARSKSESEVSTLQIPNQEFGRSKVTIEPIITSKYEPEVALSTTQIPTSTYGGISSTFQGVRGKFSAKIKFRPTEGAHRRTSTTVVRGATESEFIYNNNKESKSLLEEKVRSDRIARLKSLLAESRTGTRPRTISSKIRDRNSNVSPISLSKPQQSNQTQQHIPTNKFKISHSDRIKAYRLRKQQILGRITAVKTPGTLDAPVSEEIENENPEDPIRKRLPISIRTRPQPRTTTIAITTTTSSPFLTSSEITSIVTQYQNNSYYSISENPDKVEHITTQQFDVKLTTIIPEGSTAEIPTSLHSDDFEDQNLEILTTLRYGQSLEIPENKTQPETEEPSNINSNSSQNLSEQELPESTLETETEIEAENLELMETEPKTTTQMTQMPYNLTSHPHMGFSDEDYYNNYSDFENTESALTTRSQTQTQRTSMPDVKNVSPVAATTKSKISSSPIQIHIRDQIKNYINESESEQSLTELPRISNDTDVYDYEIKEEEPEWSLDRYGESTESDPESEYESEVEYQSDLESKSEPKYNSVTPNSVISTSTRSSAIDQNLEEFDSAAALEASVGSVGRINTKYVQILAKPEHFGSYYYAYG